jgi:hypothetical protein
MFVFYVYRNKVNMSILYLRTFQLNDISRDNALNTSTYASMET